MESTADRAARLLAEGRLTPAQQAKAVRLGLLPSSAVDPAAQAQVTNADTIRAQAAQALAANRAFLAIASPTNAQTLAAVRALARQNNGIIRLLLGALDGTD